MSETNRGYSQMLRDLGRCFPATVVLDAGLATSMQTELFQRAFPERYFNLGIAEQNAASAASGLARRGLIPLLHTFSNFLARRAHDQIAISVAWPACNVKLIAGSCGVFDGRNGPSHMAIDDLAAMSALPGMTVVEPGDAAQTETLLTWIVQRKGPAYFRLRRNGTPVNLLPGTDCLNGAISVRADAGARCTLVACGSMLEETLRASDRLDDAGIPHDLLHLAILRSCDCEPIAASALRSGLVVTVENHVPSGGFGDLVARAVGPLGVRHVRLSLPTEFIPAGDPAWQLAYCRLNTESIAERVAVVVYGTKDVPIPIAVSSFR